MESYSTELHIAKNVETCPVGSTAVVVAGPFAVAFVGSSFFAYGTAAVAVDAFPATRLQIGLHRTIPWLFLEWSVVLLFRNRYRSWRVLFFSVVHPIYGIASRYDTTYNIYTTFNKNSYKRAAPFYIYVCYYQSCSTKLLCQFVLPCTIFGFYIN